MTWGPEPRAILVFSTYLCECADLAGLERQLRILRAYALVTYPFVCIPFLYLFFRQHGIDLATYGTVVTVYYATMFVADVPTSVIADKLGQRAMMVLGPIILAAGFVVMFYWRSLAGFCVGEALLGLGHSALSGPPSALLYELLRRHGQEHRYLQEEARVHARRLIGTGSSFLLGGLLAWTAWDGDDYGYAVTLLPTAGLCALAGATAMFLQPAEPSRAGRWRSILARAGDDLRLPAVRWLLAYWVVLFSLLRYPFHVYQVYLAEAATYEPLFAEPLFVGGIYATMNLAAAPLSRRVPTLVTCFGRRTLFWAMPIMLGLSISAMGAFALGASAWPDAARLLVWLGIAMFFVQQIPYGMHWALAQEFVNHRIQPDARSTVWSVLSLGGRAAYAPINSWLFRLQKNSSTAIVLVGAGLGGLAVGAAVMWGRPKGLLRGKDPAPTTHAS